MGFFENFQKKVKGEAYIEIKKKTRILKQLGKKFENKSAAKQTLRIYNALFPQRIFSQIFRSR